MKHLLSGLLFIAAVSTYAVATQAQYGTSSRAPSGSISIEPSTTPTRPPPQDNAVAPAPGIASTPQNGDTKVDVDLRAPRIRCGDKSGEAREICLRDLQSEDQIRLPADIPLAQDSGGMARSY